MVKGLILIEYKCAKGSAHRNFVIIVLYFEVLLETYIKTFVVVDLYVQYRTV